MLASVQVQSSLVRRQIQQLQQSAATGRLPPHLSGTPLRPRLTRARTNLDVVWRSLSENRDPLDAKLAKGTDGAAPRPRPRRGEGEGAAAERLCGVQAAAARVSRSVTHLHHLGLGDGKDADSAGTQSLRQPLRQPLRTIQGTGQTLKAPSKAAAPVKQAAKPTAATTAAPASPDAVYQTIDEKDAKQAVLYAHYDKPVSPPVPVDPSRRKRYAVDKPGSPEGRRAAKAQAAVAAKTAAKDPAKPKPGPKPSAKGAPKAKRADAEAGRAEKPSPLGHHTLPRKLPSAPPSMVSMALVEIEIEPAADSVLGQASSPSSTLPHKKSSRGSLLWRRFSFNPVSRWDDWSNSKKNESKRANSCTKSVQLDQRPPVPNRPLPPTPRPQQEKPISEAIKGGLLPANLDHQPWFHNVDRKQAEELIKNGVDGYFLIRPSSQSQNPLTLTLWYNQRVYNISVRQRKDGRIALGFEKPDEQSFSSIEEMVLNYQSENLLLFSRNERTGRTVLKNSPPKISH